MFEWTSLFTIELIEWNIRKETIDMINILLSYGHIQDDWD